MSPIHSSFALALEIAARPVKRPGPWVLVTLAVLLAGCHEDPACVQGDGCPEGTVCQLDGTCRPLLSGPDNRFAAARRLVPRDWGYTRADQPSRVQPDTDALLLGGSPNAVVYLAFGPLPQVREIAQAVLTLWPHPGWEGPRRSGVQLAVQRIRGFDGQRLTHENAPEPFGLPVVVRRVMARAGGPIRLDVTRAARRAQRQDESRIHLRLSLSGRSRGGPWKVASSRAADRSRRPQLHLLFHR
jgi:hypothetical protein